MISREHKYWLGFSLIEGVGANRLKKIYNYFGLMENAWQAGFNEFKKASLEDKIIQNIIESRKKIELNKEVEKMEQLEIKMSTMADDNYPISLRQIFNPPSVVYYKGKLTNQRDEYSLACVGTRKFSPYGKQIVEDIVKRVCQAGITLVSGLALGIDSLAHRVCVETNSRTIAVLGSGIDEASIYPASNIHLARDIQSQEGLLMSEYPPGTTALQAYFPQRNRIIAGLSKATLVVEAPGKSGALITARFALENNRDVLAVPGNIYTKNAAGVNQLIAMGAYPIVCAEDIFKILNFQPAESTTQHKQNLLLSEQEKAILEIVSVEAKHINDIIQLTGLPTAKISSFLTIMEIKGLIKNVGNQKYSKN